MEACIPSPSYNCLSAFGMLVHSLALIFILIAMSLRYKHFIHYPPIRLGQFDQNALYIKQIYIDVCWINSSKTSRAINIPAHSQLLDADADHILGTTIGLAQYRCYK